MALTNEDGSGESNFADLLVGLHDLLDACLFRSPSVSIVHGRAIHSRSHTYHWEACLIFFLHRAVWCLCGAPPG